MTATARIRMRCATRSSASAPRTGDCRSLLGLDVPEPATAQPRPPPAWEPTLFRDPSTATDRVAVDGRSSPEAKIALFRSLFAGRDDAYAARWENERSKEVGMEPRRRRRAGQRTETRS